MSVSIYDLRESAGGISFIVMPSPGTTQETFEIDFGSEPTTLSVSFDAGQPKQIFVSTPKSGVAVVTVRAVSSDAMARSCLTLAGDDDWPYPGAWHAV